MAKDKKYETTNPVFKEYLGSLKEANKSMKRAIDKKNTESKKIIVTVEKDKTLGLSPSEKKDIKPKQTRQKESPSAKIKGERNKDLARLEKIKENQAAEDAAKKKKAVGKNKSSGQSVLKTGIRKNKQYIGKKLNMGGAIMKNRGGMFKGNY